MKLVWLVAAIATVGMTPNLSTQERLPRQAWGQAHGGLRLGIAAIHSENALSPDTEFDVAVENTGTDDFVVNLGYMLANGRVMFPSAIRLTLTDPSGRARELEYFDRRYPGVAGRVDDFTVALRARSVYTVRITMDHYWSPATQEFGVKLLEGRHHIVARFQGDGARATNLDMTGGRLMNFWQGAVQSESLEFVVPGQK